MTTPTKAQIEAHALVEGLLEAFLDYEQSGPNGLASARIRFKKAKQEVLAAMEAPKPAQSQIEAVKDVLRRFTIITGDSPWDWDDVARKVLVAAAEVGWKCKAQRTADPPQDCGWPVCGCDPYADKVITALEESGALKEKPIDPNIIYPGKDPDFVFPEED